MKLIDLFSRIMEHKEKKKTSWLKLVIGVLAIAYSIGFTSYTVHDKNDTQQKINKLEKRINQYESQKKTEKTETSDLVNKYLSEALFWYEEVFPTLNSRERMLFWKQADIDNNNYISVEEAKDFLDKIKSKYQKVVEQAWVELRK